MSSNRVRPTAAPPDVAPDLPTCDVDSSGWLPPMPFATGVTFLSMNRAGPETQRDPWHGTGRLDGDGRHRPEQFNQLRPFIGMTLLRRVWRCVPARANTHGTASLLRGVRSGQSQVLSGRTSAMTRARACRGTRHRLWRPRAFWLHFDCIQCSTHLLVTTLETAGSAHSPPAPVVRLPCSKKSR
jgi:hypothetical protein